VTTDIPQPSDFALNGDHEHAWRCLEDGDASGAWAFECTICHRTRAGLRVGKDGKTESALDAASKAQHASADERERALDVRESRLRAQEVRQDERRDEVEIVRAEADLRDAVTDARDGAAARFDITANMQAWLNDVQNRPDAEARQEALDDRMHSRADRKSSAGDRAVLADDDVQRSGT